jgi:hypothetical protein
MAFVSPKPGLDMGVNRSHVQFVAFTSQNAKEFSQRGHAAKAAAKLAGLTNGSEYAKLPSDEYAESLRLRVREEIDRLVDMLAKCKDAQDKDRLSRALDRLAETERKLSGRPLPGAYRPEKSRAPARGPVEPV